MDEALEVALQPILQDLRGSGLLEPRLEDRDWTEDPDRPSVMMWRPDGSGTGLAMTRSAATYERVAEVADQVQEWAIEGQLWGTAPTNWPRCPHHPHNHPLLVTTSNETAVWVCPTTREVISGIGEL